MRSVNCNGKFFPKFCNPLQQDLASDATLLSVKPNQQAHVSDRGRQCSIHPCRSTISTDASTTHAATRAPASRKLRLWREEDTRLLLLSLW